MWLRSEVEAGREYRVALCQAASGRRSFALHPAQAGLRLPVDAVLLTETVPPELVLHRRIRDIAQTIPLTTGQPFFLDAHNVWFTADEWKVLDSEDDDWASVPWLNGIAPILAPK